jgi:hypothetical protein
MWLLSDFNTGHCCNVWRFSCTAKCMSGTRRRVIVSFCRFLANRTDWIHRHYYNSKLRVLLVKYSRASNFFRMTSWQRTFLKQRRPLKHPSTSFPIRLSSILSRTFAKRFGLSWCYALCWRLCRWLCWCVVFGDCVDEPVCRCVGVLTCRWLCWCVVLGDCVDVSMCWCVDV